MKKTLAALVVAFALTVIGCQNKQDENLSGVTAASGTVDSKPSTQVPATLQNDGYHYYGLSRTEPATYLVTINDGTPQTGTETVKFKGMDGNKAKFDIERTGALGQMGSEQVVLDEKGVTVESTSPGTLQGNPLDMPASLKPGDTWKTDYKVILGTPGKGDQGDAPAGGGSSEDHSTFKVVGPEKIKTKAGTFDSILVESDGKDTLNGQEFALKTQSWYVKDRGAVKIIVTTLQAGKATTLTIEAAPGDPKSG